MVLDSKLQQLQLHFGISELKDWQTIRPEWILSIDGIGPATLDQVRLHLAAKGLTLQDDETAVYWRHRLGARAGQAMSESDVRPVCPFTIITDSMEQQPFTFQRISVDRSRWTADIRWKVDRELLQPSEVLYEVPTVSRALGTNKADYSAEGLEGVCHIERKSVFDAHSTILGWGKRRENFEKELAFLQEIESAAVVVECSFGMVLYRVKGRGKKTADENRRILFRQVLAWQQDFRVPWLFCDSRAMAEVVTFRIIERAWRKQAESRRLEKAALGKSLKQLELL